MPRYEVQHRYKSNDFGPWVAGDQVTLDNPDDAAFVNRDSPGTLVEIDPEEQAARKRAKQAEQTKKVDPDGGADVPQKDRTHKGGRTRS